MGVIARGRVEGAPTSAGTAFDAEWLFTDRRDGVSVGEYAALNVGASVGDDPDAVAANRARVAGYLGAGALALVRQVHGRDVARLTAPAEVPPDAGVEPRRRVTRRGVTRRRHHEQHVPHLDPARRR